MFAAVSTVQDDATKLVRSYRASVAYKLVFSAILMLIAGAGIGGYASLVAPAEMAIILGVVTGGASGACFWLLVSRQYVTCNGRTVEVRVWHSPISFRADQVVDVQTAKGMPVTIVLSAGDHRIRMPEWMGTSTGAVALLFVAAEANKAGVASENAGRAERSLMEYWRIQCLNSK